MEMKKHVNEWKIAVLPFLDSKVEELQLMGYPQATRDDVWKCLEEKVWKGNTEKRLHEITHHIMHLKSSTYLSYLTVNSYKNDDLMASISAIMDGNK